MKIVNLELLIMTIKKLYIVIIFLYCAQTLVWSQQAPYINYTTHKGLPQIQVQFLHQDSKGYIWVGTKGGLAKFNGEYFENFLENQYIFRIDELGNGNIMIGTRLGIYLYVQGKMKLLHSVNDETSFLAGKDRYWLYNNTFIKEIKDNKVVKTYSTGVSSSHFTYHNFYDKTKNIPFFKSSRSQNEIYYIENNTLKTKTFTGTVILKRFENGTVYVLIQEGNAITAVNPLTDAKYFIYSLKENQFKIYNLPVKKHVVNTYFKVFLLHSDTKSADMVHLPIDKMFFDVIHDLDGNYWVATDIGLFQINNGALQVFPTSYMSDVWTLVKGKNGKFYAGEYKHGLFEMDINYKKRTEVSAFQADGKPEKDFYYGACLDKIGNIYFPTQTGILKYNYHFMQRLDDELSIITAFDSISNQLIAGQENGIAFFDVNHHKTVYKDQTKKIITTRPTGFAFRNTDEIWIGSWENLAVFNRNSKTFQDINTLYQNAPTYGAVSLDKDYNNNLWIGGTDGLWFFNERQKQFSKIAPNEINKYILDVQDVDNQYLLVGTSHELYILNLKKFYEKNVLEYKMYNYRNGFVGEEIAQNGFWVDANKVYIPSTTVTSVLDLDKVSFKSDYFNVFIKSVNGIGLSNAQQFGKEMVVLPDKINKIELQFESVGFGLPTKTQFQYFLEGTDDDWSKWDSKSQVTYTNLKSGTYTFKVRALDGSMIGSNLMAENTVKIKVNLPFYREPNFYQLAFFLLLLFGVLLLYLIYIWYKNTHKAAENERKLKFQEIATLQAQMNPHFIFNFLSSVQSIINQNMPEKANEYLVKFSRLMRSYMESSIKNSQIYSGNISGNEISIKDEIDMLKTYMDLEKMKYPEGKINYDILIENQNILNKTIPPLILQPFVENAIKHGILPKNNDGWIKIKISETDDIITCLITDNGIGRKESIQRKQQSIPANKSRGLELIKNRVEVLNQLGYHIQITFIDPDEGGTIIQIKIG